MAEPNIRLKSVSINEPKQITGEITGAQTATLTFVVECVAPLVFAELTVTVGHQEDQVDDTVRSAQRILLEKFEALCAVLRTYLPQEENERDCQS